DTKLDQAADLQSAETRSEPGSGEQSAPEGSSPRATAAPREDRDRGTWRSRRRRRNGGRERDRDRDRDRFRPPDPDRQPEQFGPRAGYEPIVLPGESISKYRNRPQNPASQATAGDGGPRTLSEVFPQDEPLFLEPPLSVEDD